LLADDGMSVDFSLAVRQVDMTAIRIAVGQLCGLDKHRSVAELNEVAASGSVAEVVTPDVPSLPVLFAVRRRTVHGDVVILSHVPHCSQRTRPAIKLLKSNAHDGIVSSSAFV